MNIEKYISSGILELYVYGVLSEEENTAVYEVLQAHPELEKEIREIEVGLMQLSTAVAPYEPRAVYDRIKDKLELNKDEAPVIPLGQKRSNWPAYLGWAASIALLIGLVAQFNINKKLQQQIVNNKTEKIILEGKINVAEEDLSKTKLLLNIIRNKDIIAIPLQAQEVDPTAYAAVYWDKKNQTTYIDVVGLPTPPPGKVYQVWSLKLNPLTPTSLGVLDDFENNNNKVFALTNRNESEAFGITLEPEGGSESPTLEQLYTLGMVAS